MKTRDNAGYPSWALESPYVTGLGNFEETDNAWSGYPDRGQGLGPGGYDSRFNLYHDGGERYRSTEPPPPVGSGNYGGEYPEPSSQWSQHLYTSGHRRPPPASGSYPYESGAWMSGRYLGEPGMGMQSGGTGRPPPADHSRVPYESGTGRPPPSYGHNFVYDGRGSDRYGSNRYGPRVGPMASGHLHSTHASGQRSHGAPPPASDRPPLSRPRTDDTLDRGGRREVHDRVVDPFTETIPPGTLTLNPLIEPLDNSSTRKDRLHFRWNMLHPSWDCQLVADGPVKPWIRGVDEPATWPRLSRLNIISPHFPREWIVSVIASDQFFGVTCGDIIEAIHHDMYKCASGEDYQVLGLERQEELGKIYRLNRTRMKSLGEGMKRLDFLGHEIMFGGITEDEKVARAFLGTSTQGTFVLKSARPQ